MTPTRRREAIVDAALEVIRAKGLAATTVRDVAAAMGTSSGLVHHYFGTMDEVIASAFDRVAGDDLRTTGEAIGRVADPTLALAAFIASYAPLDADRTFQLWLDAWAEAARRPALRATSSRLNLAWQAMLEQLIRKGQASGAFRNGDPAAAAWRILSVLDGLALQVVAHGTLISRPEMQAWAAAAAERELGLPAGTISRAQTRVPVS